MSTENKTDLEFREIKEGIFLQREKIELQQLRSWLWRCRLFSKDYV